MGIISGVRVTKTDEITEGVDVGRKEKSSKDQGHCNSKSQRREEPAKETRRSSERGRRKTRRVCVRVCPGSLRENGFQG